MVLVELALDVKVVLHEQTAVDDLPRFNLHGSFVAPTRAISAIPAELRLVLRGFLIEYSFVRPVREVVFGPTVLRLELWIPFYRSTVEEKCDRIIALDRDTIPVQIPQLLCAHDR